MTVTTEARQMSEHRWLWKYSVRNRYEHERTEKCWQLLEKFEKPKSIGALGNDSKMLNENLGMFSVIST